MISKHIAAAMLGAVLATAGPAFASTLSYSFDNPLELTDMRQTGSLGLFDPTLGILNSVILTLSGRNTTFLTLSNSASLDQLVRATASTDLFFESSLAGINALLTNPVISLDVTTGFVNIAPGATATFGPLNDASSVNPLPAASLFLGTGAFSVSCRSLSGLDIRGGGGNVASTQATQAACGASIAYDYTPATNRVPEPATLALLGVCAVGIGSLRWKAKRG